MIIKPADSDREHICKGGFWIAVEEDNSSSSANVILSSDSDEESSSSSNSAIGSETNPSSSSSSSVIASETKQSSSSGYDNDDSSSSSEEPVESSSSEETKLYLCEDGETYVLDPANCEKESSSSVAVASSSSDNKPISSSSDIQESSSSEMSSSSEKIDSSSSTIESSSNISSSSIDESSSSEKSSSSLNNGYDAINNTLTDSRDGQVYKTVTIGSQVWMAQNLNYLPEDTVGTIWAGKSVCGGGEWRSLEEGDCSTYGRLYESSFTNNAVYKMEICPTGWSLPTKRLYERLISFLGDDAGNKLKIDNPIYWTINDSTNQSGFSAIPAGDWSNSKGFNNYEKNSDIAIASFAMEEYQGNNALKIKDDRYLFTGYGANYYIAVRCIRN